MFPLLFICHICLYRGGVERGTNEWKSARVSGRVQEALLKIQHSLKLTFMGEVCEWVTGERQADRRNGNGWIHRWKAMWWWESKDELFYTPNFNIHLSDHFLPLFPAKDFHPTETPFISRACWPGRHWARDREIESEREREWWWEYRFPSVGLHCSRASGVWDGTGKGEGARRERLCWGEGWGSDGGGEGMRERGYSVAAESPLACLLRSTSDWAAAH